MTKLDDLPDDILINILSRLPAKFSVLSRRIQHLWRQVPDLSFEFTSLELDMGPVYQKFVESMLQGRTSLVVRKFSLYCYDNIEFQSISNWIDYSVNHSVEELKLQLEIENFADQIEPLPVSLFSCPTIVKFDLCNYGWIIFPPNSEGLRSLRIWTLKHSEFVDGPRTTRFFQHCPSLEKLKLEDCIWSCQLVQIACPLLRSIIILRDSNEDKDCKVVIMAPRLEYFEYEGEADVEYSLIGCTNLLEANIDVSCPLPVPVPLAESTTTMVGGLSSVRTLALSSGTLQILNTYYDSFREMVQFENLTMLIVTGSDVDVAPNNGLFGFLKLCNSLVHLEATEGMFYTPRSSNVVNLPLPTCLSTTLTDIRIHNFEGTGVEVNAVRRWLNISTATVSVYFEGQDEKRERFRGRYGHLLRSFNRRLHIRQ